MVSQVIHTFFRLHCSLHIELCYLRSISRRNGWLLNRLQNHGLASDDSESNDCAGEIIERKVLGRDVEFSQFSFTKVYGTFHLTGRRFVAFSTANISQTK